MVPSDWPTPTVALTQGGQKTRGGDRSGELLLKGLVEYCGKKWPTMTVSEAERGHGYQRDQQGRVYPTLTGATGAAQAWPTPDSGVFNYAESPASFDARARKRKQEKQDNGNGNGKVLAVEVKRGATASGRLNPRWVEALMGFPAGWSSTDGPPLRGLSTPTSPRAPDPDNPTTESD